jgi:hypothetical protein
MQGQYRRRYKRRLVTEAKQIAWQKALEARDKAISRETERLRNENSGGDRSMSE